MKKNIDIYEENVTNYEPFFGLLRQFYHKLSSLHSSYGLIQNNNKKLGHVPIS